MVCINTAPALATTFTPTATTTTIATTKTDGQKYIEVYLDTKAITSSSNKITNDLWANVFNENTFAKLTWFVFDNAKIDNNS